MKLIEKKRFKMVKGRKLRRQVLEGLVRDGILSIDGNVKKLCKNFFIILKKSFDGLNKLNFKGKIFVESNF